jgi:ketosteroid isomerase-like protein
MEQNTLSASAKDSARTEEIVTGFFERLAAGDPEGMAEHFAEAIDWYVPGDTALPWVGRRSRRTDVASYFRTMWPHFVPGKSTASIEKLIVSGNDAVMLGTFTHTATSTGRSFTTPVAMHLAVDGDKILKLYLYEDTWAVSKAFFD